jgi:hypothetical protein
MKRSAIRDFGQKPGSLRSIRATNLFEGTAKNPLASRERLAKHRLPGVLAVAGTSMLAFRKPNSLGDHSFQDIRMDCSKGRKPYRFGGMQAGVAG